MEKTEHAPFSLTTNEWSNGRTFFRLVAPFLRLADKATGLARLQQLYDSIEPIAAGNFAARALDTLDIRYETTTSDLSQIPETGPAVIVANHPFGGVEGIIIMDLLRKIRPDVKLLANHLLERIPELCEHTIPANPFGGRPAKRKNFRAVRQAIDWIENGGLLVAFPAGEVSSFNLRLCEVIDPPWKPNLARIIRKTGAPVIPAYFPGRNSLFFQVFGMLHPLLRTALLPRQLLNKKGRCIKLHLGQAITAKKLRQFEKPTNLIAYLRWRTYFLACHDREGEKPVAGDLPSEQPPVISPIGPNRLQQELERLPERCRLLQSGEFDVFIAEAAEIPMALREIGRLREVAFRSAGEGSGKPIDLNMYDNYYLHLFIWQREKMEIVGGYRIGRTDRILPELGHRGLYSSSLFRINRELLNRISPALEMGRSFVRSEYQKSYAPLLLLWKGIGRYIAWNPQYRYLFGPVSISREYSDRSRQLIASSLADGYTLESLEGLVQPKFPVNLKPLRVKGENENAFCRDIDEISELVAELELDNKGIPVLIRHYLNLGGRLLAFNLDRQFCDVIDGLLLVDLCRTESKLLQRYMGREGIERFTAHHAGRDIIPPQDSNIGQPIRMPDCRKNSDSDRLSG